MRNYISILQHVRSPPDLRVCAHSAIVKVYSAVARNVWKHLLCWTLECLFHPQRGAGWSLYEHSTASLHWGREMDRARKD